MAQTLPASSKSMPPKPNPILRKLQYTFLKLAGWQIDGEIPPLSKFVLICSPHTSNWDMIFMLCFISALGVKIQWMGKASLFRPPLGFIFRGLGGISVNRNAKSNMVQQMVEEFNKRDKLVIGILPAGTRYKRDHWKTGFYHMAIKANVPIVLSFIDYKRKLGFLGPVIWPTGDIEADVEKIRPFYDGVVGKNPENMTDIRIKPSSDTS